MILAGLVGRRPAVHVPVFVLTHHAREPVGRRRDDVHVRDRRIEPALASAREAAGERDVVIAGGASVVQQYLGAGLVDEFTVSVAPLLLGSGTRLLEGPGGIELEQIDAVGAPA